MRRNWLLIGKLLSEIENGTLWDYLRSLKNEDSDRSEVDGEGHDSFDRALLHLELLQDAGYIRDFEIKRTSDWKLEFAENPVRITMSGYDLMEIINDKKVWNRITGKAKSAGIAVTCEFVKAMIPEVIRSFI